MLMRILLTLTNHPAIFTLQRRIIKPHEFINMNDARDLCLDRISSLPAHIIDSILSLLPIKLAVRTSVLSRDWRYNWTTIPVLHFDQNDFIKESTAAEKDCVQLDEIIHLVSHRGDTVKLFRLHLNEYSQYRLPSSIFALRHLTNLWLAYGCIYHQPTTFNGFCRLTYLCLLHVKISTKKFFYIYYPVVRYLRPSLLNLKEDDILGNDRSSITDLIECLPAIQTLRIAGSVFHCFFVDSLPQERPISLVGLENLYIEYLEDVSFLDSGGLPSLFRLIQCSPILQILTLIKNSVVPYENELITLKNYSNIWLKNLKEFEIYGIFDLKLHLEFVRLILAKSPMLKKVGIWVDVTDDELSNISRLLLQSPRASGSAKITVERYLNE